MNRLLAFFLLLMALPLFGQQTVGVNPQTGAIVSPPAALNSPNGIITNIIGGTNLSRSGATVIVPTNGASGGGGSGALPDGSTIVTNAFGVFSTSTNITHLSVSTATLTVSNGVSGTASNSITSSSIAITNAGTNVFTVDTITGATFGALVTAPNIATTNVAISPHGAITWSAFNMFIGNSNEAMVFSGGNNQFTFGSTPGATDGSILAFNFIGGTFHGSADQLTNVHSTNIVWPFNTNVLTGAQMYDGAGNLGGTNFVPNMFTNTYVPPWFNTNLCVSNGPTPGSMELISNINETQLILNNTNTTQTYDLSFAAFPNVGLLGGLTNHYKMAPNTITYLHLKYFGTNYQSSNTFFAWVTGGSIGAGGGSQTPWLTDINAAQHSLTNIESLSLYDNRGSRPPGLKVSTDATTGYINFTPPSGQLLNINAFADADIRGGIQLGFISCIGVAYLTSPEFGSQPYLDFGGALGGNVTPDFSGGVLTNYQSTSFSFLDPVGLYINPQTRNTLQVLVSNVSGSTITVSFPATWHANWQNGGTASIPPHSNLPFDITVFPNIITNVSWPQSAGGSGTLTSAGLTMDGTMFNSSVTGSPITTSGTFTPTLANAAQNSIWGGPPTGGSGAPSYQLVPTFNGTNIQGVVLTNGAQANYEPVYTPGSGVGDISWFPATNVDIVTTAIRTNFLNGQIYTNNTGSLILLIGSTTNVDGGVISTGANTFTIAVSNTGYSTWSNYNTGGNVVATSIAGLLETNTFNVPVDTNGIYMLSTTASGSGNSSGLIPGTGQIVTIGNATASGVGSLGGNNVWTGNNIFTLPIVADGSQLKNPHQIFEATWSQNLSTQLHCALFNGTTFVSLNYPALATNVSTYLYGVITITNVQCFTNSTALNAGSNYSITLYTNGNNGTGPLAPSPIVINLGMSGITNPVISTPFKMTNTIAMWVYGFATGVGSLTQVTTITAQ